MNDGVGPRLQGMIPVKIFAPAFCRMSVQQFDMELRMSHRKSLFTAFAAMALLSGLFAPASGPAAKPAKPK
jgi:hypothetical protein